MVIPAVNEEQTLDRLAENSNSVKNLKMAFLFCFEAFQRLKDVKRCESLLTILSTLFARDTLSSFWLLQYVTLDRPVLIEEFLIETQHAEIKTAFANLIYAAFARVLDFEKDYLGESFEVLTLQNQQNL